MEPENCGSVQMVFLLNWGDFSLPAVKFPGCTPKTVFLVGTFPNCFGHEMMELWKGIPSKKIYKKGGQGAKKWKKNLFEKKWT